MIRVMVVEDEIIERKALIKLLYTHYSNDIASITDYDDGCEALAHLEEDRPHIVFMDIHMHSMDGLQASELILSKRKDAKIIIVTAHADFEYAQKCIGLGIKDYLVKPYSTKTLKTVMDKQMKAIEENSFHISSISNHENIEKAMAFIANHYQEAIKLEEVADYIGFSKFHFSRVFKEETSVSFSSYITKLRIYEAKKLLTQSDLSIKEVAYAVGYMDPNYFAKSFKKSTGITPSEYIDGL